MKKIEGEDGKGMKGRCGNGEELDEREKEVSEEIKWEGR